MPENLDKNIITNIKKCSRCALCAQNCPIFNIKKDENNTARGLVCKLLGFEENILTKDDLKKDFKICLNCSKCAQNCPSKVDTTRVFSYFNSHFFPSHLNQKIVLFLKFLPIKFLYFKNILNKFQKKSKNVSSNITYFKGCMARAQHKTTLLDRMFQRKDFACCAMPYLASGDLKQYELAKEKNIELIKASSKVVFDCASCYSAVRDYEDLPKEEKEKLVYFYDLINLKNIKLKKNSKYFGKTVTFHKPCHLNMEEFLKIEEILKSIEGINYKRLENFDTCCGFGGSYFIFHPIVSTLIALKKAKTIKKSKADLILSLCPSCVLGLRFNQLLTFNFKKTLELRDFFDKELEL